MTLVCGVIDGQEVIMGGDRAALSAEDLICSPVQQEKVFLKRPFVIGGSGSFRMIQVLQYEFVPPKCENKSLIKYMVTDFVSALRSLLPDMGFPESGEEAAPPGQILVGARGLFTGDPGRLFVIQGDYAVIESLEPYDAIGSGARMFLPAVTALKSVLPDADPGETLAKAMQITARNTFSVQPPFDLVTTAGF
jgi:hypothetical protein